MMEQTPSEQEGPADGLDFLKKELYGDSGPTPESP